MAILQVLLVQKVRHHIRERTRDSCAGQAELEADYEYEIPDTLLNDKAYLCLLLCLGVAYLDKHGPLQVNQASKHQADHVNK